MSMGRIRKGADARDMSDINVTPLVDVMLVLLIVFMITMPVLTHSLLVNLPTSVQQKSQDPIDPLYLNIDEKGQYFFVGKLSGSMYGAEELNDILQAQFDQNPELILAISADEKCEYEHVARAIDLAKEIGIAKLGFVLKNKGVGEKKE